MERTPASPSTPGEGTRQTGCIVARLRAEIAWEPEVSELLSQAADEIERLRLTDAERFVLREVCTAYADRDDVAANEIAAVIDGLLERTR